MLLLCFMLWMGEPGRSPDTVVPFEEVVAAVPDQQQEAWGDYVVKVAKTLLRVPYKEKLLEVEGPERLVVRLDGYDCVTYVETVLSLANLVHQGSRDYSRFQNILRDLRYREGHINGYASRLHYTTDWRFDNQSMGYLKDVTREIGGVPYTKEVSFMSRNPQYYAALSDEQTLQAVKSSEKVLNQQPHFYIPETELEGLEDRILDGDIIAITTKVAHLDIAHLGFAVHVEGRLHLLHASSKYSQVTVSPEPLVDELLASRSRHGVMVFRPLAKENLP